MNFFKSLFNKNNKNQKEEELVNIPYTNLPNEHNEDLSLNFAEKFTQNKCKFFFCENQEEIKENLQQIFTNENIGIVYCKEDKIFDLLTNFDIGFTEDYKEKSDATILLCDYLEAETGKVYISKEKKNNYKLDLLSDKIIIIGYDNQIIEKFINLYNDYYSIQNQNQYTTFSLYKKEIILLLVESNK